MTLTGSSEPLRSSSMLQVALQSCDMHPECRLKLQTFGPCKLQALHTLTELWLPAFSCTRWLRPQSPHAACKLQGPTFIFLKVQHPAWWNKVLEAITAWPQGAYSVQTEALLLRCSVLWRPSCSSATEQVKKSENQALNTRGKGQRTQNLFRVWMLRTVHIILNLANHGFQIKSLEEIGESTSIQKYQRQQWAHV